MILDILITFVLFNAVVIFVLLLASISKEEITKYEPIRNAQIAFLGISFMQYSLTFIVEASNVLDIQFPDFAQKFRYVSWLITTPLLLYSYWKLAKINGYKGDFTILIFADLVMFICIILSEAIVKTGPISWVLDFISVAAYGIIFWKVLEIRNFFRENDKYDMANLGIFFLGPWILYLFGVIASNDVKYLIYTLADFINKFLYGRALNDIIDANV